MRRSWLYCGVLYALFTPLNGESQMSSTVRTGQGATVTVVAFRTTGNQLGAPTVTIFEDTFTKVNMASKFRNGIAQSIPYGKYRIEISRILMPSGGAYFIPEQRYVSVDQPQETILIGLDNEGIESQGPRPLRGSVVGELPTGKQVFVKMTGLFSSVSAEATVAQNGAFVLGGITNGPFLLTVFMDGAIIASRWVSIPKDLQSSRTGPFQVVVGRDQVVPQR